MNIKSLLFSAFSLVAFLSSAQNFDFTPSQNIDEQIQEEIKKNRLPTNHDFIEELYESIQNIN